MFWWLRPLLAIYAGVEMAYGEPAAAAVEAQIAELERQSSSAPVLARAA